MTPFKIAAFPFDVRPGEVAHNLAQAQMGLKQASAAQAQLLVLPEKWTTSFLDHFEDSIRLASDAALETLHAEAQGAGMVVVGSAPGGVGKKPANELHFLGAAGNLRPYQKRMLFSPTGEARQVERGKGFPQVVETPFARICGVICYDLRFPELCRAAMLQGADILLCCAQWPHPRVPIFELMSRARAAENQVWVVSCNRSGQASLGVKGAMLAFPGMALWVNPLGEIVAREDGGRLQTVEVDLELVQKTQKEVPLARDLKRAGLWNLYSREPGCEK